MHRKKKYFSKKEVSNEYGKKFEKIGPCPDQEQEMYVTEDGRYLLQQPTDLEQPQQQPTDME
ncbi:MAG: hypothetical protein R6U44_00535 [Archaeoglobaceae archaeon]